MALGPSNRFKRVGTYTNDQLLKDLRDFEEEVAEILATPSPSGEKGDKGDPGIQGTPGIPGLKGDKGDKGDAGARGLRGTNGEDGVDGEDGDNAVDRNDYGLIDVDLGLITEEDSGDVEDYGGVDVSSLPQGAGDLTLYVQGDRGPRGYQGEQGIQGPQGEQGIQGDPGPAGADGIDGVNGADGADGATGPAGPGLPVGGTTGQIPRKVDGVDYNTAWHTPVKADVGLANVDNTSDVNKPVSTAQQAALDLCAKLAGGNTFSGTQVFSGLLNVTNGQIQFPAVANPSADAHTMDDYEEGTFIPRIDGSTTAGVGTYSAQVGRYTKIGNLCAFSLTVVWTAHTGTGNILVEGLPFTVGGSDSAACSLEYSALIYPDPPLATVQIATTRCLVRSAASGSTVVGIPMDSAATIRITSAFFVN